MSVLLDVQAVQNPLLSAERGIGRYTFELARAMERWHPGRVFRFLLSPDLPVPRRVVEGLSASGRLAFQHEVAAAPDGVFHVASPLEGSRLQRIWPAQFRDMRLAVTLLDLIPARWPEFYMPDPAIQRAYSSRLNLFRIADRVITISEASARDAVDLLGLRRERVVVAGAGVSEHFQPPTEPASALRAVEERRPSVGAGYILYTGGADYRKNMDGLLTAYAGLPEDLKARHQLVIVGRLSADEGSNPFRERLEELGISHRVVLLGFVPEDELVLLYQACELFVFPSLYEGFGLPVLEAMACGAPAIAGRNSSLVELIEEEDALFDAANPNSIRAALERSLTDDALLARLRQSRLPERHTWRKVADTTAAVYEDLLGKPRRGRRRQRIGYVAPLLAQASQESEEVYGLLGALRRHFQVDPFFYQASGEVSGLEAYRLAMFETVEEVRGGYDAVLLWLGNTHLYAGALDLLRRRSSIVLARDVRLTDLYAWCARERPDIEPRGFYGAVQEMYSRRVPPFVGEDGGLDPDQADRYGILMAREAIRLSRRFFVRSHLDAKLARLDAGTEDSDKVSVLPSWGELDGQGGANASRWQVPGRPYVKMAERLHQEILLMRDAATA
ncbi:MAG: glycosyltransferase family 4 protein [Actinomycetota bacterium]|nr:glycosyltransferase family 4 protein [Actinomycetota bacterium]